MATEFVIPKHTGRPALGESCAAAAPSVDILDDLSDHDALFITEADAYERCEALARAFLQLSPLERSQAVDVLAANLRSLCTSAQQLLSDEEPPTPPALQQHRNGLKMIVHLLHIIAVQAHREADQAKGAENAAAKPVKATGRGKKAAAADAEWDWQASRQLVLLAVHDVMRSDLRALFKGLAAAERMVNVCLELALQAVESPSAAKQEGMWVACRDVLIRGAVQHEQLDFVAAALMERARRHEHVPLLAADAAKHAEEKYNSTQLAVKLLAEFWSCSPEDYDTQYATDAKSVRQAGEVVVQLAELLPKVVSNHISQLRPYLACSKAASIRGALMAATGSILLQVYPATALNSSLGAGAQQAHLRSKEALLELLLARILDKAAYVRQRVLQTWAKLVEESCVPLPLWNTLLAQAISRLQDESQLVVKAALQLLSKMLHRGVFPPPLDAQRYLNSLKQAEEDLAALLPAGSKQHSVGEGRAASGDDAGAAESEEEEEAAAAGQKEAGDAEQGAAWEQGDIQMGDAGGDAEEGEGDGDEEQGGDTGANAANQAAITRQRTMVASLKEGASFCKRLGACLPQVQLLLASPHAPVVHDAIVFLTFCKTFEVTGAAHALRGMWPLVFSKVEAVKDSALDSWNILHLRGKSPAEQLSELVKEVIPGCSLAELTALEALLAALAAAGSLQVPPLVRLLVQDTCHYFTRLQQLQHEQRERQQRQRGKRPAGAAAAAGGGGAGGVDAQNSSSSSSSGGGGATADAMDVDGQAAAAADAAATAAATTAAAPEQQSPEHEAAAARALLVSQLRHLFAALSMLAGAQPGAIDAKYVPVLLEIGFSPDLADAWVTRHTCLTLQRAAPHLVPTPLPPLSASASAAATSTTAAAAAVDPLSPEVHQQVLAALVRLLVGPPADSMAPNWPSAAEAAVAAVYALCDQPQEVMAAVLQEMFSRCTPGTSQARAQAPPASLSAAALSRFFFVLGRTALQHLLCIEQLGKAIRQTRLAAGRAAAEAADRAREAAAAAAAGAKGGAGRKGSKAAAAAAAAQQQQQQADEIGAMLGAGAVTADAELDDLVDMIEAQILAKEQLLGRYGALLSRLVHLRAFITYPQPLQASALLALTQLMAVSGSYCADNVAVLFTLLYKRLVAAPVRINLVVALADLASRFPNVLEPWTAYMYEPLSDPEPSVKLSALSSLTHLVLGGMLKAKGNVAKVAMLLVDDCPELVDRAVLFFESLAASGSGNSRSAASAAAGASAANPVYNLLPDCLSALLAKCDPPLREEQMQVIMTQLLAYVKDKQAESLRERLVVRLQLGGPREWRLVAWCIAQLGYSEKGLRRIMEMTACYRHTLGEQQVFDVFMTMAKKATGSKAVSAAAAGAAGSASTPAAPTGLAGDFKSAVEEWVADLVASREAALEAAEVEAMAASQQQQEQEKEEQATAAEAVEQQHDSAGGTDSGQQELQQQRAQAAVAAQAADADVDAHAATTTAPAAAAAAGDEVAEGSSNSSKAAGSGVLQAQELVLVQSQDIRGQDDLEPSLLEAAAAAVAAAGMQRMSLAGSSSSRAAGRASTAAAGGSRAGSAARRSAAAAGVAGGSSSRVSAGAGAARQKPQGAAGRGRARGTRKALDSSDGDSSSGSEGGSSDGDDGSSSDSGNGQAEAAGVRREAAPACVGSRKGVRGGTRSSAAATAGGSRGTRGNAAGSRSGAVHKQAPARAVSEDSSSEDDD